MEVNCRIKMVKSEFVKMSKIIEYHDFSLGTKIRILRCYINLILLYRSKIWTLTETLSTYENRGIGNLVVLSNLKYLTDINPMCVYSKECKRKIITEDYRSTKIRISASHNEG